MTNDTELPPELRDVEDALAARPAPGAGGEVRARVLAAVSRELAARAGQRRAGLWRFAATAAALVLLWLNLSLSAVNGMEFALRLGNGQVDERAVLAQVSAVVPECTAQEVRRHVLLLRARAHLVGAPQLQRPRMESLGEL